jgi:hypothetical protein
MNIIKTAFSNKYSQQDLWDKTAIYGTIYILYLVDTYFLFPYSDTIVYKNMWTFCVYNT